MWQFPYILLWILMRAVLLSYTSCGLVMSFLFNFIIAPDLIFTNADYWQMRHMILIDFNFREKEYLAVVLKHTPLALFCGSPLSWL
jgi:hypothetical protein